MVDKGVSSRYGESRSGYEDDEPRKPKMDKQVLIAIGILAVGLVALFMWVSNSMVSKNNYKIDNDSQLADIGTIQTSIGAFADSVKTVDNLNTQVSQLATQINALTNDVASVKSGYAKVDSLAQTNTELTNIKNSLNTLQAQVNNFRQVDTSGLSASIEALRVQVEALQDRLEELETPTTIPVGSDPITFTTNTLGNMPVQITVTENTTQVCTGSWQMIVNNTTDTVINNIVLGVGVAGYGYGGVNYTSFITPSTTPQLVSNGGTILWSLYQSNTQGLYFVSGWGYGVSQLSIPANSSLTLWVTLQMSITTPVGTALNTQLILQPFVQSYN
jgi:outer membrane murein-binding lipoprotein Lpp